MCRYAWHNYRDHFACFDCRKAFKYWQWEPVGESKFAQKQKLQHVPREIVCPDCDKPMIDMGLDFKAPKKTEINAWEVLKALAAHGFTFHSCGCSVGFAPPKSLREVPQWIEEHRRNSDGEKMLDKIEKNTNARQSRRKPKPEPKIKRLR